MAPCFNRGLIKPGAAFQNPASGQDPAQGLRRPFWHHVFYWILIKPGTALQVLGTSPHVRRTRPQVLGISPQVLGISPQILGTSPQVWQGTVGTFSEASPQDPPCILAGNWRPGEHASGDRFSELGQTTGPKKVAIFRPLKWCRFSCQHRGRVSENGRLFCHPGDEFPAGRRRLWCSPALGSRTGRQPLDSQRKVYPHRQ